MDCVRGLVFNRKGDVMFEIIYRDELARDELGDGLIILNEIRAPRIAEKTRPGQFVILKANETGERIPLTISDFNRERGTITVIYMVVGKSTEIFKSLKAGNAYQDVIGPLGKPTEIEKVGTMIAVGGGTGIAVLFPITRGFKEAGNKVISIIGAKNKDLLILEDKMASVSDELHPCTDDGSYGHKGFVTDKLREMLQSQGVDLVVAIGPVPMMKFVSGITAEYGVKTMVSLNPIMIDGTGMCGGCRVTVGGKTRFACVDGPEFDGHQVDFDNLSKRLQAYSEQEKKAHKEFCAIRDI
jgi:ferredoxin/flavodoxin---NADP+ reductase